MLDNNFEGLDNYEVADSEKYIPRAKKSSGEQQLCCLGRPLSVGRMIAGLLVLFVWIVVFFASGDGLDESSLEYFIIHGSSIPTLIIAFGIWLGGKK